VQPPRSTPRWRSLRPGWGCTARHGFRSSCSLAPLLHYRRYADPGSSAASRTTRTRRASRLPTRSPGSSSFRCCSSTCCRSMNAATPATPSSRSHAQPGSLARKTSPSACFAAPQIARSPRRHGARMPRSSSSASQCGVCRSGRSAVPPPRIWRAVAIAPSWSALATQPPPCGCVPRLRPRATSSRDAHEPHSKAEVTARRARRSPRQGPDRETGSTLRLPAPA
jgi:hypothetical protein